MEGKKNYKLEWNRNKNKKGGGSRKTEEKRKILPQVESPVVEGRNRK